MQMINKVGMFKYTDEEKREICRKGGFAAAKINREFGRAIFDPEVRKRQHITLKEKQVSAFYDPVLRKNICSKGGKAGIYTKEYYEKRGLPADSLQKLQSKLGKRGGPKNKGFKWYNDGNNSYKYTKKQQDELSFDIFLENNKKYFPGPLKFKYYSDGIKNLQYIITKDGISFEEFMQSNPQFTTEYISKNNTKGYIFVNNGVKNMMIHPDLFDENIHIKGKIKRIKNDN